MLWIGYRNKYPMIPYMIILGMGRLGFLLGTFNRCTSSPTLSNNGLFNHSGTIAHCKERLATALGSLAILALILLSGVRFVSEFFRDAMTNHQLGQLWYGLNGLQWMNLAFICLFVVLL